MSYITQIGYDDADASLRTLYDEIKGPGNYLDNIIKIHGLRPPTLRGHLSLYKNIVHHTSNTLPKWFIELTGVYVSLLNQCGYCVEHHSIGVRKNLPDDTTAQRYLGIVREEQFEKLSEAKFKYALLYAKKLTLAPAEVQPVDIALMKQNGFTEGEILELNQVVGYFCYANRTVLGLGVTTDGDQLGWSPAEK